MSGWLILWLSLVGAGAAFGIAAWLCSRSIDGPGGLYAGLGMAALIVTGGAVGGVGLVGTLGWLIVWCFG